jgi:hypothetical protein
MLLYFLLRRVYDLGPDLHQVSCKIEGTSILQAVPPLPTNTNDMVLLLGSGDGCLQVKLLPYADWTGSDRRCKREYHARSDLICCVVIYVWFASLQDESAFCQQIPSQAKLWRWAKSGFGYTKVATPLQGWRSHRRPVSKPSGWYNPALFDLTAPLSHPLSYHLFAVLKGHLGYYYSRGINSWSSVHSLVGGLRDSWSYSWVPIHNSFHCSTFVWGSWNSWITSSKSTTKNGKNSKKYQSI